MRVVLSCRWPCCTALLRNGSADLVVFFKLHLVMVLEGICSERKLVESASLILTHRKYLGYTFDEPLPDYSRVTRIRQWLGIEVFERFVERVVDLCWELVLVWGYDNGTGWFPLRALLHQSAAGELLATQERASLSVRQRHDQFERCPWRSVVMLLCSSPR
jgi:hypothetical protein